MIGCLNCGKFISMDWDPCGREFCTFGCRFDYHDRGDVPQFNSEELEKNLQESYKLAHEKWIKNYKRKIKHD